MNYYRFSLSWSRILPDGRTYNSQTGPNPAGIAYYDNLINALIANGIEPMVTLFHWDLPQSMMDIGGFLNPDMKYFFANYSRFVFDYYGDRVKKWLTLNEPGSMVHGAYCADAWAPSAPGEFRPHCAWTLYLSAHNMLLSHLESSRVYRNEFQATQKGIIGIAIDGSYVEPYKNRTENAEAARVQYAFGKGWYSNPIYSPNGDYSDILKERIANASKNERRVTSRLPEFTPDEIEGLKNSADYIGCNYYNGDQAENLPPELMNSLSLTQEVRDAGVTSHKDEDWAVVNSTSNWVYYSPWTLREMLRYFRDNYGNKPVYITENGVNQFLGEEDILNDQRRIHFLRGYLSAIAAAIEDGCNVVGYTHWSLMDNFEWLQGYSQKFGLYYVNFTDPNRQRIPKASVEFYKTVAATHSINGF